MLAFWILVVLVAAAQADYGCKDQYKCADNPHFYFQCSNGIWYKMKCPKGLKWDMYKATCNYPGKASCDVPVHAEEAKQYGPDCNIKAKYSVYFCHDKAPGLFWQCSNGLAWEMKCPKGLHFDLKKTACVWPKYASCEPLADHGPAPHGPAPVNFAPKVPVAPVYAVPDCDPKKNYYMCHDKKPGLYWQCGNGLAYEMLCPKGLVFNTYKLACTYPYAKGACGGGH